MPRQLTLAVVGIDYPNKKGPGRRFEIAMLRPGDRVFLECEPDNPADKRAVAVYSPRFIQIGYITAERAPFIGGLIRSGAEIEAVFQAPAASCAYIRVGIDEIPDLPPEPVDEPPESDGFWPDEEPDYDL